MKKETIEKIRAKVKPYRPWINLAISTLLFFLGIGLFFTGINALQNNFNASGVVFFFIVGFISSKFIGTAIEAQDDALYEFAYRRSGDDYEGRYEDENQHDRKTS